MSEYRRAYDVFRDCRSRLGVQSIRERRLRLRIGLNARRFCMSILGPLSSASLLVLSQNFFTPARTSPRALSSLPSSESWGRLSPPTWGRQSAGITPVKALVGAVVGAVIVLVVWGFVAPRHRPTA